MSILLPESLTELPDIFSRFVFAVDHNTVSPCSHIGISTLQRIAHRFPGNQTLDTSNHHKIIRYPGILAGTDLITESLYRILRLNRIRPEQGILFQPHLVLDDHCRNAMPFQRTNSKHKMFDLASGIPVKNDRLRRTFQDIVQILQTRSQVYRLYVRLALAR